jgi:hypothetical protein
MNIFEVLASKEISKLNGELEDYGGESLRFTYDDELLGKTEILVPSDERLSFNHYIYLEIVKRRELRASESKMAVKAFVERDYGDY